MDPADKDALKQRYRELMRRYGLSGRPVAEAFPKEVLPDLLLCHRNLTLDERKEAVLTSPDEIKKMMKDARDLERRLRRGDPEAVARYRAFEEQVLEQGVDWMDEGAAPVCGVDYKRPTRRRSS